MEPQDVAAAVLNALGIEQPDIYTAGMPTGIYKTLFKKYKNK